MLKKYSHVLGLPVISASNGLKIGNLKDVVFSKENKGVIAFIMEKGSNHVKGNVVLLHDVLSLGNDALIIDNPDCLLNYRKFKKSFEMRERIDLRGLKIYTKEGEDIGVVQDILFDYKTGKVEGVQVSDGLVQDILKGRSILPFIGKVEISSSNILIESDAIEEMVNTGGGLQGRLGQNTIM
ncbi:MAG TPA: PRC-barrel domain-containing protein [Ruminiclostridium sp.]|nr:PRC-barrel domain-containing protein [Ruminiclostridium sp.]